MPYWLQDPAFYTANSYTILDGSNFTEYFNLKKKKIAYCDLQVYICYSWAKSNSLLFSGNNEN